MILRRIVVFALMSIAVTTSLAASQRVAPLIPKQPSSGACFVLFEMGVGEVRRNPDEVCKTSVSPASTFKIPHALAALDSGVIANADETLVYDGTGNWPESSRRDHTLASAVRHSVVWYFQRIAERLGAKREQAYLKRFSYGNKDPSSGLTKFWLGGSLLITPDEQLRFLSRLYKSELGVNKFSMDAVKAILIQPNGVVVNAMGAQPFNAPWPKDLVLSAKTGSANDASGSGVRWLVGHIQRGERAFLFVSCVIGTSDVAANAAIDLAATSLRAEGVW